MAPMKRLALIYFGYLLVGLLVFVVAAAVCSSGRVGCQVSNCAVPILVVGSIVLVLAATVLAKRTIWKAAPERAKRVLQLAVFALLLAATWLFCTAAVLLAFNC
jgi:hypothetical protein